MCFVGQLSLLINKKESLSGVVLIWTYIYPSKAVHNILKSNEQTKGLILKWKHPYEFFTQIIIKKYLSK